MVRLGYVMNKTVGTWDVQTLYLLLIIIMYYKIVLTGFEKRPTQNTKKLRKPNIIYIIYYKKNRG